MRPCSRQSVSRGEDVPVQQARQRSRRHAGSDAFEQLSAGKLLGELSHRYFDQFLCRYWGGRGITTALPDVGSGDSLVIQVTELRWGHPNVAQDAP